MQDYKNCEQQRTKAEDNREQKLMTLIPHGSVS